MPTAASAALNSVAGEEAPARQRVGQGRVAALADRLVQFDLAAHVGAGGQDARSGEGLQPADVRRGDEVPGGTQHVGAQDDPIREGLLDRRVGRARQAQAERPFRAQIVLGLDGSQPGDDFLRRGEARGGKLLLAQTVVGNRGVAHGDQYTARNAPAERRTPYFSALKQSAGAVSRGSDGAVPRPYGAAIRLD